MIVLCIEHAPRSSRNGAVVWEGACMEYSHATLRNHSESHHIENCLEVWCLDRSVSPVCWVVSFAGTRLDMSVFERQRGDFRGRFWHSCLISMHRVPTPR